MSLPNSVITSSSGIPPWLVYATLPAIGVVASGIAIFYAIKSPTNTRDPDAPAKRTLPLPDLLRIVAAVLTSSGLGAGLEAIVNIRSIDLTTTEAATLALSGSIFTFVAAGLFWSITQFLIIPVLLCVTVIFPIFVRYGARCAGQSIRNIFIYRDRETSLNEFWRRFNADQAWDEYATALASALNSLKPAGYMSKLLVGLSATQPNTGNQGQLYSAAEQLLETTLNQVLGEFNAHTGCNKFRFSLWRIDSSQKNLERIWMVPESDTRPGITLWGDNAVGIPASHAAESLLSNQPNVMKSNDSRLKTYPNGRLGTHYIAIRANPIHAPDEKSPWGLLYIDLCHGSIPLEAEATSLLARKLVSAIEPLSDVLKLHTIEEAQGA